MTPRVLVVTPETGEPQLRVASQALQAQIGVEITQVFIHDRPIAEAEAAVHARAVAATGTYDWVLKLDGDMVPARPTSILELVERASASGCDGRYTELVADWYTRTDIEGVHLLKPGSVPKEMTIDEQFHDRWIRELPGTMLPDVTPAILHAPDPSFEQAVRFGLQRGAKARAQGMMGSHWYRIDDLLRACEQYGDPRRTAAVAGAAVGLGLHPQVSSGTEPLHREVENLMGSVRAADAGERLLRDLAVPLVRPFGLSRTHSSMYRRPIGTLLFLASAHRRRVRRWLRR